MGVWLGPMGSREFYKYTGTSEFSQSGDNWEIKLLSGTNASFKFNKDPGEVDIFLVGAGAPGAGGSYTYNSSSGVTEATAGKGGNGGECKTIQPQPPLQKRKLYTVTIGSAGSNTFFENYIALGGSSEWSSAEADPRKQGGAGTWERGARYNVAHDWTPASAGSEGYYAFNEVSGSRYGASGGGGGAAVYFKPNESQLIWTTSGRTPGSGGTTGGGTGGGVNVDEEAANNGNNATFFGAGGGGGGACGNWTNKTTTGGSGGNGVIIIRNHRST